MILARYAGMQASLPVRDSRRRPAPSPHAEREELHARVTRWLDVPLAVLGLITVLLLVVELLVPLDASWAPRVEQAQNTIWVIFIADFVLELALAPSKLGYLRHNWLTALAVALPAVRALRLLRVARALRGLSLLRIITTLNRATRALGQIVRRGQLGYVLGLTGIVTLTAAAGVYLLERGAPGATIQSPTDALWWSSTIVTTINSSYETVTVEGRILGLLLRVFAVGVTGYLTAIIAVHLLGTAGPDAGSAPAAQRARAGARAACTCGTRPGVVRHSVRRGQHRAARPRRIDRLHGASRG